MGDYDKAFQVIEERHQAEVKALREEIENAQNKRIGQRLGQELIDQQKSIIAKLENKISDQKAEIKHLNELLQSFERISAPVSKPHSSKKKAAHK